MYIPSTKNAITAKADSKDLRKTPAFFFLRTIISLLLFSHFSLLYSILRKSGQEDYKFNIIVIKKACETSHTFFNRSISG